MTKQINNSSPLKGRPNKLGKVIKSAIPMLAMLGGGAAASVRNVSSSVNGRRLKSEAKVYVTNDKVQQEQVLAQDNAKQHKTKRSAFGAFSYAKKATSNVATEVAVNKSALDFLKKNDLLTQGDSIKATLSGNMLGRKTFANFCHSINVDGRNVVPIDIYVPGETHTVTPTAQVSVITGFTSKTACTAAGNIWHVTTGGVCTLPAPNILACMATSYYWGGNPFPSPINVISTFGGAPANSAPTDISLTSSSVNQSDGVNAVVGTLSTTDADGGDSHTYTLVAGAGDTNNGSFNISGSSLRVNDAAALSAGSYSIRINTNDGTDDFAKQFTITVVDNIAPVFENSTPSISAITGTGATLSVDLDEDGTVYYVVVANGASAPSANEVKAGTGSGGSGQLGAGNFTTSSTTGSEAFSGLANSTDYDIYVVAQDDEGSPNMQASATKVDFTTIDSTAPVFENSTPSIGTITGTGATLSVDLDEDGTVYYVVVANGASAPSVSEVKAGTGSGGSGQLANGSFATTSTTGSEAFSGLSGSTAYDIYVVAEDDEGSPNVQASATKVDFTTIDSTAPVFENSTPSIGTITGTGATLSVDLDEDGTVYYVVVANGASAPSVAEVKAGTGTGGSGQLASGNFNTSSTTGGEAFSGLSGSTAYDIYVVAQDDEGSPNVQASATKVDFTTIDSTAPTITAVSIPNSDHKVGDVVTATITVSSDSDDYTTGSGGISGTINGFTLSSLSKTNDTTYTATFTITDGGTDVGAGSDIAVNFTLTDSSGNTSGAFTTAISQGGDAIYANLPEVNLTTDTNTIAEDGGVATLTATLSGSLNNYWPADITVGLAYTGTGTSGTDYSKVDSIVISSGSSSNTASLTAIADTIYDAAADETAIVDINSLSVGTEGSTNQQTITITDAESAPVVVLSTDTSNVAENGGTSTITATLSHGTYANVTVNLSYSGTATGGGTDYNTPSSSITINSGATSANATTGITAVDDAVIDADETIIIDVSSVTGGSATESGTQQQTVTITDDEDGTAPSFDSSPTLSAVSSNGGNVAVDLNEEGSVYYLVVADGESVPTAAQIKAGADYGSTTVLAQGTINTTSTVGNRTITTLTDGTHYDIYVVAEDSFANLQDDSAIVRLDLTTTDTLPNITSITISGSPADTATSVDFDIVFADEVNNVSSDDFTANLISGDSNQAPAITGITGSGTNYTVSVNTGITVGDLRIDLNDSTNISDENGNIPSAYTSGEEHTIDTNNLPTITEASNSVGPFTLDEDVKTALDLTDIVIADGNDDELTVTLSVDRGLLFASDGNGTVSDTTISGANENGSSSITLTGLSADITAFFDDDQRIHFQTDENDTTAATLSLSGDDQLEVSATFSETLTITAINDAPTISGDPTTSLIDGNAYSFIPTATDIEGDTPLAFSITNKPAWASFDTDTGELSGNPTPADVGITSGIVIRVEDPSLDGNDLAAFDLEIIASNLAPEISQGTSTLVNMSEDAAPTAFALSLDATDVNNDSLTWSVSSQASNGTAQAAGNGSNQTVSYTPNTHYQGNDSFIVSVSDGLLTDTITVNVAVASVNDLPSFSSNASMNIAEDSLYSYSISVTDVDDTSLTISATTKPDWLTLTDNGNGTASLTGTPTNENIGNNSVTLRVLDDENGQDLQSFTIAVTNTNDAPVISGSPATIVAEDSAYSFIPVVNDVDSGDSQTFSITGKPSWASFDSATGALTGIPTNDDIGNFANIVISVSDAANASDSLAAFTISVTNTNDAPVISGSPITTIAEDSAYSFIPVVNDVDSGDSQTFSITGKPSWASFNSATGALTGTPSNDDVGSYANIVMTVTDSENASDTLSAFTLTVTNTNDAPEISGTPTTSVAEDSAYSFIPVVNDVDSGDSQTFSITGKPAWASFDSATGALTGTPTNDDVGSYANIIISVADMANASDSLSAFSLTVTNTNDIAQGENQALSLAEDSQIEVEPIFNDDDGDELTFQVVTAPTHGDIDQLASPWVYTPNANYHGEDTMTITANDGSNDSTPVTISFTITPVNDAPEAVDDVVSIELNQENTYLLDVLENDIDIDEDTLMISAASASLGQVNIVDGQLQYVAQSGFVGDVQLSYSITDEHDEFSEASVSLMITGSGNVAAPELIVPEAVTVNATGLFTKVDLGIATAMDSNGKAIPVSLVDGVNLFTPGKNLAYWQTTDNATGLSSTASQIVNVNPLISLSKNLTTTEGANLAISVLLNGQAPSYPVEISYSISGTSDSDDHNLTDGTVVITSGSQATIDLAIATDADIEGDETLIITLDESLNLGAKAQQVITITEENVAPEVTLTASQNSLKSIKFTPDGGDIIITAQVSDVNVDDIPSVNWGLPAEFDIIEQTDSQVHIDASTLPLGVHRLSLTATDDGLLSKTATLRFIVVAQLPVLQADVDSDGDLIPDSQEGFTDADNDGIPDYLDAIAECNVLPEQIDTQQRFLVEGEPGVCLQKGHTVAESELGGIQLSENDINASIGSDTQAQNVGGIFDYIATGLPTAGQQYSLVLPQRQPIPDGAVYRKFNETSGWGEFIQDANNYLHSSAGEPGYCPPPASEQWTSGLTAGHWCVQLTISDGGPNDDDGLANGTIVDPGGVAVMMTTNTMPLANQDNISMLRNESRIIDVLSNDSDADGDPLTLGVVSAIFGEGTITAEQMIDYTPPANFAGIDTITYSISDGNGGVASSTAVVEVRVNQAPVINSEPEVFVVDDHSTVTVAPLLNVTDVDNDTLTITTVTVDQGSIVINGDHSLTYTPELGYQGNAMVSYWVSDGENDPVQGSFTIEVTPYENVTLTSKSSGGSINSGLLFIGFLTLVMRARKIFKLRYLVALMAAISSSSQAQQSLSGFFVGGGLNQLYSSDAEDEINKLTQGIDNVDADASRLGWQLHAGYQFDNHWRLELGYHDLDDVKVSFDALPSAIDYQQLAEAQAATGSGIAFVAAYQWQLSERLSLQPRLGLMHWSSDIYLTDNNNAQLARAKDSDTDVVAGLVLEYQLNRHWSMYAQLQNYFFEDNVSSIGLGVNYYWGKQSADYKPKKAPASQQVSQPSQPKPVAVVSQPKDSDDDGVIDQKDQCPATSMKHAVDVNGCAIMETREVEMQVVLHFANASSEIQPKDQQKVQKLAEFIGKYQVTSLTIYGHTSAQGPAAYNKTLSLKRAQALLSQLHLDYGIDENIMTAIGLGEEALLDNANTATAHQINRRVEIHLKEVLSVEKAR
ncbi:Ig-like domain-containing protein [Thalassotalea sp. PLHSN55]|uniref:Ig-like domain-containing protein n=1 Tax=Thalassotalea sp. PLHSN55 TaxID=3435888 RepID=UPI003F832D75